MSDSRKRTQRMPTVPLPATEPVMAPLDPASLPRPSAPSFASVPPPSSSLAAHSSVPDVTERTTERRIASPGRTTRDRASLTVLKGVTAGQVFALERDTHVLGRGTDADVWIDDPGVSRSHARLATSPDGSVWAFDLGSTNGTFVDGVPVLDGGERVRDGARLQLGPTVVLRYAVTDVEEDALQKRLYESSTRDALTLAYNRKHVSERLETELAYAHRHGTKLSVLLLDLDDFKAVNDTYGHLAGDRVLRQVSAEVQRTIRTEDVLGRWGGEELLLVARGIGRSAARRLGERVRVAVAALRVDVDGGAVVAPTLSLGAATLSEVAEGATAEVLLALADERLYLAKARGKNRVVGAPHGA